MGKEEEYIEQLVADVAAHRGAALSHVRALAVRNMEGMPQRRLHAKCRNVAAQVLAALCVLAAVTLTSSSAVAAPACQGLTGNLADDNVTEVIDSLIRQL